MAVIRFQVEVDSDVYPELYARLSTIKSPASRGERVRQLAASGLVWEVVRMHGPAAIAEPAPAPVAPQKAMPAPPPIDLAISAASAGALPPHEVPVLMDVVADDAVVSTADEPPLPPPLHTETHANAPRSRRMKRMVDRGLFRNG